MRVVQLFYLAANRDCLFERVYPISPKAADNLISSGQAQLSRFSQLCPVTLYQHTDAYSLTTPTGRLETTLAS
ncbi:unnamed protein product, partial [Protopolystoma xenopodis]